jgi:hypothetical protein
MDWHVQYRGAGVEHVVMHPSPEMAIEAACCLMDDGADVFGIGAGALDDSIDRDQIARIYALWTTTRCGFSARSDPPVGCWNR